MVNVPSFTHDLPPVTPRKPFADGMIRVLAPCVVNDPVPIRTLPFPVTSNRPTTVPGAVPPKIPPESSRLGRTTDAQFKFSVPPLTVTGANSPETALPFTFNVPPLTVRPVPV